MPAAAGLHYEWYGDEGAPPLILSSGLGGLAGYWEPNLLALAEDYRVLVYDHGGTGASEPVGGSESVEAMAAQLCALLDELALDEAPGFVGHALGGLIGLQIAMTEPERLLRLMVVNGWARLDPHTARCFDVRTSLLEQSGPRAYLHAQPLFLYPPAWISEHDDDLLRQEADQLEHFPGVDVMTARIHAARMFDPGRDRLRTVGCPVMCLGTEDDFLVPVHCSEALAASISGATLASMAHGGHAVNVTRPEEFNSRVRDWLR